MDPKPSCSTILFSFLLGGVFLIILIHLRALDTSDGLMASEVTSSSSKLQQNKKEVIYLIQAESCLSRHMNSYLQRANGIDRDVIVLSWKNRCIDKTSNSSNVIYIFNPRTTWSSGRNLLYQIAFNRGKNYLYYIFVDEDIEFYFTPNTTSDSYSKGTEHPLTAFEKFLRGYEPAIGLCNYCSRCGKPLSNGEYVEALCCSSRTRSGKLPTIFPAAIAFDAALNAFHARAIGSLLPYRLDYEPKSWWESQKYVILTSDILFRGQVVRYTRVTAINTEHRSYPQQQIDNWASILEDVRSRVPGKYRNQSVFSAPPIPDMVVEVIGNILQTERWNVSIPAPKTPIVPYSHFDKYSYA